MKQREQLSHMIKMQTEFFLNILGYKDLFKFPIKHKYNCIYWKMEHEHSHVKI